MKKTELKRKTPIGRGSSQLKKTTLKGSSLQKKSSFYEAKTIKKADRIVKGKTLKKASLAGFGRTDAHKVHHDAIVQLGCFPCRILQTLSRTRLCVHHIDGRRNSNSLADVSEYLVFCCCDDHHRPSVMVGADKEKPSVHFNKREFIAKIGTESWCVHETFRLLNQCPLWLSDDEWFSYLTLTEQPQQEAWIVDYEKRTRGYKVHHSKVNF